MPFLLLPFLRGDGFEMTISSRIEMERSSETKGCQVQSKPKEMALA